MQSMYMYTGVPPDLVIVKGEDPDDPGQVLPALGLSLVTAGVEVAGKGRRSQREVPGDNNNQGSDIISSLVVSV